MSYVEAKKTPDGNLRLVLLPEAREDLLELRRAEVSGEKTTSDVEAEVLEDLLANGFQHIQPEDVGALTSAPMITDDWEGDERGESVPIVGGSVYAFMDYQVRSIVEDLAEKGFAIFQGAKVERATKGAKS